MSWSIIKRGRRVGFDQEDWGVVSRAGRWKKEVAERYCRPCSGQSQGFGGEGEGGNPARLSLCVGVGWVDWMRGMNEGESECVRVSVWRVGAAGERSGDGRTGARMGYG